MYLAGQVTSPIAAPSQWTCAWSVTSKLNTLAGKPFHWLTIFEFGDVADGRGSDVLQCFAREERLMAGNDDIRKRQQPREHVVGNDQAGAVFEKDLLFFFVNVESEIANLPALQCSDYGDSVQQPSTTGVDEHDAGFHFLNRSRVNHAFVLGSERAVQRDDVRPREQFVQFEVLDAGRSTFSIWNWIECHDWTTESDQNLRNHGSNFACANDAGRFPVKVESEQTIERKIALAHAIVGAMQFAVQREHQTNRVLRHL